MSQPASLLPAFLAGFLCCGALATLLWQPYIGPIQESLRVAKDDAANAQRPVPECTRTERAACSPRARTGVHRLNITIGEGKNEARYILFDGDVDAKCCHGVI